MLGAWVLGGGALAQGQTLHVFAAASLKESFQAIAKKFEASHPGVTVELTFAGSQQLAAQIGQGAPCDVFASADERNLAKADPIPGSVHTFAYNHLVMIGSQQNGAVKDLVAFANANRIVVAAAPVPVGGYTRKMIAAATPALGTGWADNLKSHIVSEEQDVRAVLTKVELGEADEGIVYATDAAEAGKKVFTTPIPAKFQPEISYPVGVEKDSDRVALAKEFMAYLLSHPAQQELAQRGFVTLAAEREAAKEKTLGHTP